MKALLASVVFLSSLFLMRQLLVGAGLLSPPAALYFLAAAVGIPLGGIVFLEAAFDRETRELRSEIERLRREVSALRDPRSGDSPER